MQPPGKPSPQAASAAAVEAVVLVGGSIRSAAESASRGGLEVYGCDRFGDTDTLAACRNYRPLKQWLRESGVGNNVPSRPPTQVPEVRSSGQETRGSHISDPFPPAPVILVGGLVDGVCFADRSDVLGLDWETRRALRAPSELAQLASSCGFAYPVTRPADRPPPADSSTAGFTGRPRRWLWKQFDSSGGLGVRWFAPESHPRPGENDPSRGPADGGRGLPQEGFYQRWIAGRPFGATFLGDGEAAILLGVCRSSFTRLRGEGLPFVYAGSAGPVPTHGSLETSLRRLGDCCAGRFGIRGLFNADLIVDDRGQPWLLEINPRWTAASEVIEQVLLEKRFPLPFRSLFRLHWELLSGRRNVAGLPDDRIDASPKADGWCWKRVVFATRSGRFVPDGLFKPAVGEAKLDARFADLPPAGRRIARGEPLATVLCHVRAGGRLPAVVQRRLIERVRGSVRGPELGTT